MPIPKKLLTMLDAAKVRYEVVPHRTVFTAYDLAQTTKSKLQEVAKTLLVKADARYVLVTIPAHRRLDFKKLKTLLKAKAVSIVTERTLVQNLKAKPGTLTPFGSFYKVVSVLDRGLLTVGRVLVGAGSFTESLRVKVRDLVKLDEPTVGNVAATGSKTTKRR